ncbi:MAG: hypothetical protein CSA10_01470 [Cardiobacteriales bacterium]|nr:MAG: hypothetical protein CSA10_01470 [Cardiobacteriales bacterium]
MIAMLDARMGEIYTGLYERDGQGSWRNIGSDRVCSPEALPILWLQADTSIVGSGLIYQDSLSKSIAEFHRYPCYAYVVPLARELFAFKNQVTWQAVDSAIELHYLRNEVTQS